MRFLKLFRRTTAVCKHDYEVVASRPKHRGRPTMVCLKCGHMIDPLADEGADAAQWESRRLEMSRRLAEANRLAK